MDQHVPDAPAVKSEHYSHLLPADMRSLFHCLEYLSGEYLLSHNYSFDVAVKNMRLNRYRDQLPYDTNRVTVNADTDNDYINASLLSIDPNMPGYIATQAPIPSTFAKFWLMILETKPSKIIALVDELDRKCERYWPTKSQSFLVYEEHGIQVTLLSQDTILANEIIARRVKVECGSNYLITTIVHYLTWPDHGVPQSHDHVHLLLNFGTESQVPDDLSIVHCSAGVGRTGTYCVINTLVYIFKQALLAKHWHNQTFQMRQCVQSLCQAAMLKLGKQPAFCNMIEFFKLSPKSKPYFSRIQNDPIALLVLFYRTQRKGIVQTATQLDFIYQFCYRYIASSMCSN